MLRKALFTLLLLLAAAPVHAQFNGDDPRYAVCIDKAATAFKVSPLLIKILLDVEGGKPGTASLNTNGSYDLGPMQVNDRVWLPHVAAFGITREQVQNDACLNIYVGTWIFMQEFSRVKDIGLALAHYHSKTAKHQARYLGLVERAISRRQAAAKRALNASSPTAPAIASR